MKTAELTPEMRSAGTFPRSLPFQSVQEWQAALKKIRRGIVIEIFNVSFCGLVLSVLLTRATALQGFFFGAAKPSALIMGVIMLFSFMMITTFLRAIFLLKSGYFLYKQLRPLDQREKQTILAEVRKKAPGLLRTIAYWNEQTAIPLVGADARQFQLAMQLNLFKLGQKAHWDQERAFDEADLELMPLKPQAQVAYLLA